MKSHTKRSILGQIVGIAAILVFGLAALWVFNHRQNLIDDIVVWQYKPTSGISQLAARTDMSDEGKHIFYASQPVVENAADFNRDCSKDTEKSSVILGCYTGVRIYVYNVTDTRLDGIKETTAAHEMLHAAYQRLSSSQRQYVDKLVEAEYTKLENNADFSERMALYARTEPGERDNELHSIIGTEVGTISPQLEKYYAQYFTNRQAVVSLHNAYNSIFTELSAKKASLASQLSALASSINTETSQYNTDVAQLNSDIQAFNQKANSNGFSSQAQFNNERAALLNRIDTLNAKRDAINGDINHYQDLYKQYETIAGQSDQLNRSINSKLAPAPSL